MKKSYQEQLFIKFINGECTPDELENIATNYSESERLEIIEKLIKTRWRQSEIKQRPKVYQKILSDIHKKIRPAQEKRIIGIDYLYFSKVAATVIIFITTITFFTLNFLPDNDKPIEKVVKMITKSTEFGQKLKITLPDKSVVVLNYGTTISYPEVFSDTLRKVKLSGEAYFEIQKDASRPFVTRGDNILVSVLGTTFNFNTRNTAVALAEGSVKLNGYDQEIILDPGLKAEFSIEKGAFDIRKFETVQEFGWKDGNIYIEGYSIEKLITTLEKWYGIDIKMEGIASDKEFSGELTNNSLQNVLSGICFTLNCDFKIDKDEVKLYGKK
jgi:transmembrane sensor